MLKKELEKHIEWPAVEYAEGLGILVFKLGILTNKSGFPDQTFMIPWGHTFYIEFKTPNGSLRPQQKRRIRELRAAGRSVYVINNLVEAKNAIDKELKKVSK